MFRCRSIGKSRAAHCALRALILLSSLKSWAQAPDYLAQLAQRPTLGTYEVVINGERLANPIFALLASDGRLYVEEAALREWGLRVPAAAATTVSGIRLIPLDAYPGSRFAFDEKTQTLSLTFAPESLTGSRFDVRPQTRIVPRASHWGGFGNYSLLGYETEDQSTLSGLFELGLFGPYGTGISTFTTTSSPTPGNDRVVRLDTLWRYDDAPGQRSVVFGDSVTRTGFLGRPLRFGGVQVGTNFGLQPGFVSYPLQAYSGVAALPSTVDVLVNNQRVTTKQVPPGPFSIDNIPAANGAGDLQLVVRDIFGQERIITQPLYGAPQLLAKGLNDYAFSAGAVREDYGIDSFDYGSPVGSALWRYGLSNRVTFEGRAEADDSVAMAGAATNMLLGRLGIGTLGVGASTSDAGTGGLVVVGFDRRAGRFGAGILATFTTPEFRQVGDDVLGTAAETIAANVGMTLGRYGTLGGAVVYQRYHDNRSELISSTATYTARLGELNAYLTLSASHTVSDGSATTLLATLLVPFGDKSLSASLSQTRSNGTTTQNAALSFQKALPTYADGYGYRLLIDSDDRREAGVAVNVPFGQYGLEVARAAERTAIRATVAGGIGTLGGYVFASRPILDSFAIVTTGGVPDIQVLQENQPALRTDASGKAVLAPLWAYTPNTISIDPETTPIGVSVGKVRHTIYPAWRSGELVEFDVRRERNVVVKIVLEDGRPVPTGAISSVEGRNEMLPVGEGGEAFIVGLPDQGARVRIIWKGASCTIDVKADSDEGVPVLGPYVCRGVPR